MAVDVKLFNERLGIFVNSLRIPRKAFADSLGIDSTPLRRYINGDNSPSVEVVSNILSTYPDLSAEWLMRGVGPMLKSEAQDATFGEEAEDCATETEKSATEPLLKPTDITLALARALIEENRRLAAQNELLMQQLIMK